MLIIFKRNPIFFMLFFIYLCTGAWILTQFEKGELEILINQNHQNFLDIAFSYLTYLGDGIFYAVIVISMYFINQRKAIVGLACFLMSSFAAQFLKKVFFANEPRPKAFFGDKFDLHFVEGVEIFSVQSFPSGHSTTAFSLFCLLALWYRKPIWGFLFFVCALIASFSRVYLLQHFFIDTYFGAILGVGITLFLYWIFENRKIKASEK